MATQKDYFDSLYATDAGRAMFADLRREVSEMDVETPDGAVAKLACYELLNIMRERAGVLDGPELILAESSVAVQKEPEEERTDLLEI